jgi:hypothetical protein
MKLVDFFLENERWKIIGPVNELKSALYHYITGYSNVSTERLNLLRNRFQNYGVCNVYALTKISDFEKLTQCYLPWYKPNSENQRGYNVKGSTNYRFDHYIAGFARGEEKVLEKDKIADYIQSYRRGWQEPIEIVIAHDTSINISLIVDGTHRSLALYYLYLIDNEILRKVMISSASINICILKSRKCRTLFSYDFQKLHRRGKK